MPIPHSAPIPSPSSPSAANTVSTEANSGASSSASGIANVIANGMQGAELAGDDACWSAQERALIAGDLGDALYRVESFSECLAMVRSMVQSHQPATLVVMDAAHPEQTEPLAHFTACIASVDEAHHTLAIEVPAQAISDIHRTYGAPASTPSPSNTLPPTPSADSIASHPLARGLTLRGALLVDGVTMTFEAETLGATPPNAEQRGWMLHTRLPFRLYRIQRRDSFRVPLSGTAGVLVTLMAGQSALGHLKALDLSCGGTSVVVRAPLETVHQGKRFSQATLQLHTQPGSPQYVVNMLVRHVHIVPPALGQLLSNASHLPSTTNAAHAASTLAQNHQAQHDTPHHRPTSLAKTAKTTAPQPTKPPTPWLQLGIEFERMPTTLERELSKRVNELAVSLVAGQ